LPLHGSASGLHGSASGLHGSASGLHGSASGLLCFGDELFHEAKNSALEDTRG